MLTYLGILLYILAEMIFSEYAPAKNTNWSIFYFSSIFVSLIMISLNEIIRTYDKYMRMLIGTCLLFFILMLIQQLILINVSYDIYYESVNDNFIDKVRHIFLILTIGIISFKFITKWGKR